MENYQQKLLRKYKIEKSLSGRRESTQEFQRWGLESKLEIQDGGGGGKGGGLMILEFKRNACHAGGVEHFRISKGKWGGGVKKFMPPTWCGAVLWNSLLASARQATSLSNFQRLLIKALSWGLLNIFLGREVQPGPSYPDPV